MAAVFDRSWQDRVLEGDADAVLQLGTSVLGSLHEFCHRQLADEKASELVVTSTLVRAIREVRSYHPETYGGDIRRWIVELASLELQRSEAMPNDAAQDPGYEQTEVSPPDTQFVYRVETEMCLAAQAHRDGLDEGRGQREFHSRSEKTPVACPACGRAFQISPSRLGQSARCSWCRATFTPTSATPRAPALDNAEDRCWYLKRDHEADGPHTAAELREKISTGEIAATELVRRGDRGQWQAAMHAEGLFAAPPPMDDKEASDPPVSVVARPLPPLPVSASVIAPPLPPDAPPLRDTPGRPDHPKKIGRFEIRQWVGRGGFADVYRAYDPVLDRELALKVATSAALDDDHVRPFVLREPKAAAKLRHPHIVAVHDAGFDEKRFYMAIEFISGCTLRERLEHGTLPHDKAMQLVISLAEALDYAHRSKVLHRDVKASNIMVDDEGQALLMDFGLAQIEHTAGEAAEAKAGFHGTPGYMPPEQISRDYGEVGPHSDQYSLGIVLYELLCGRPPFEGPLNALIHNTLYVDPVKPGQIDRSIDRDVEAICTKAMAKRPEDRYASCGELAEDLRRYQEDRATIARPLGMHERFFRWCRREPILSATLGACAALLLMLVVTLAVFAAMKTRLSNERALKVDEVKKERDEKEEARREAEAERRKAEAARQLAEEEKKAAIKHQAIAYFHHGHTLCDNGQIPQGLVYLVESLRLAELAEEVDSPWNSAIRLGLATWLRELHPLKEVLPHRIDGVEHQPRCVAIHPRGHLAVIATRTEDGGGAICIWDVFSENPKQVQHFALPGAAEAVAFAADGQTFAAVGTFQHKVGSFLRVWRWKGGTFSEEEPGPEDWGDQFKAVAFSPGGSRVVVGGQSGSKGVVYEWDWRIRRWDDKYDLPTPVRCAAYSPDGKSLAIGTGDSKTGSGKIWIVKSGEEITGPGAWSQSVDDGLIHDVAFSRDGNFVAAAVGATLKGDARVWDAETGKPEGSPFVHLSEVYAVEFSPDDRFLLTASQDRSARLWELSSGRLLGHPMWHGRDVRDVAFLSSDEDSAASPLAFISASDDGVARLWDIALGTPTRDGETQPPLYAGVLIPGTKNVAVVGGFIKGRISILDASDFPLKEVRVVQPERPATSIAADSNKWAIVGLMDGRVLLVDLESGNLQALQVGGAPPHSGKVLSAAVSVDNQYGATGGEDGLVRLWDMTTGEPIPNIRTGKPIRLDHGGKAYAVAFDPRSSHILTAGTDGKVQFWNRETGDAIKINGKSNCLEHPDAILCAAYSEDGSILAVGFAGGVQIWRRDKDVDWQSDTRIDAQTGILRVHVWPERELVATGDLHGNVCFWHWATGEPIGPSLPNQGLITMLIPWEGDHVLCGSSSGRIRRRPLPSAVSWKVKQLQRLVHSITGMQIGDQQAPERIDIKHWEKYP